MKDKANLIVKSNHIVEAGYYLSTAEQRVILTAISKIPKNVQINDNDMYIVSVEDLEIYGVHPKTAYREIKEAVEKLYERSINIRIGETELKTRWVQQIALPSPELISTMSQDIFNITLDDAFCYAVAIRFSTPIIPYLSNLKEQFTQYLESDISNVTSIYSIRFYEFICQYREIGKREITIDDLRFMLNLRDKYPLFGDLKRWVIEVAIKEINDKTPMQVSCEYKKKGRKFTSIVLTFKEKKKPKTKTLKDKPADRDPDCGDLFTIDGLSDAQLARIANNPLFIAHYNHLLDPMNPANQNPKLWAGEMVKRLKANPDQFDRQPLRDYLDY